MRRTVVLRGLVGVLLIVPAIGGCSAGQYSCSNAGGKATSALRAEIQALPSTRDAYIVACDSGDPSTVYFTSLSTPDLVGDLVRTEGCHEVHDASSENSDGTAYNCRFQAGKVQVWVEKGPTHSTSSAFVTRGN